MYPAGAGELYLYAGYSLLVGDDNAPDDVAKMVHNVVSLVNEEVRELLVIRLGSRHAEELDEKVVSANWIVQALRLLQRRRA